MKDGTVTVRSVQDRELVVEGHVERQEGNERFKKQFHRRFVLPSNISSESVSSVMSADGVLIITAPKKASDCKVCWCVIASSSEGACQAMHTDYTLLFQALALPFRETIIPVAVEEGVHRTESLSHVSEESVKSRKEVRIDQQQQQESTTLTASQEKSLNKNISLDSSKKVRRQCYSVIVLPI